MKQHLLLFLFSFATFTIFAQAPATDIPGGPTGEKVNIDVATFDFGDEINSFDVGLYGSGDLLIARKLSASVQLSWGLRPLFPSSFQGMDFPLYNIFATLGVTYHLQ